MAAAVLANAQLGALAASNKLSSRGIDSSALARLASRDAKHIGFLQLNAAGRDAGLTRELGLGEGKPVELTGFVSETGRVFTLSRFYITCCVADAVPIGVHVSAGARGAKLDKRRLDRRDRGAGSRPSRVDRESTPDRARKAALRSISVVRRLKRAAYPKSACPTSSTA